MILREMWSSVRCRLISFSVWMLRGSGGGVLVFVIWLSLVKISFFIE